MISHLWTLCTMRITHLRIGILTLLLVLLGTVNAETPVNKDEDNIAISGYDSVAYFTKGRAVKGRLDHQFVWNDARWLFASGDHRDLFAASPESYAPQFGGFCAGAMTRGIEVKADPEAWTIVDDLHFGLMTDKDQDVSTLPLLDGEIRIEGRGISIREIMGSANGHIAVEQGSGRVKEVFGSGIFKDVVVQALRSLNPRRDRATNVECGFYDATIEDGIMNIDRVAVQTNTMTIVASGRIRLKPEKIDMTFRAKPREGIGVSLGTVVNSFVAIGGTLSKPTISLDPGRSATTTGVAVATGGLSLLARGLWDRVTAEASICDKRR